MKSETSPIPVVDIFAGAGGLGEGFSAFADNTRPRFHVALSIEKDAAAVDTLTLRAFFRAFPPCDVPNDYYRFLRGEIDRVELFGLYPEQAAIAGDQTWSATLGDGKVTEEELDLRIEKAIGERGDWVLVGGPPCQAYSVIGRSKNKGTEGYSAADDHRHFLYREYLRIISRHWPAVFVMENVKGILTSAVADTRIFSRMLEDLSDPAAGYAHRQKRRGDRYRYRIYPLTQNNGCSEDLFGQMALRPQDYIVESENHGIPQKRHRVIVLGIRDDIPGNPRPLEKIVPPVPAAVVLGDLPRLRSGISRGQDSDDQWIKWLKAAPGSQWIAELPSMGLADVKECIGKTLARLEIPEHGRGAEFIRTPIADKNLSCGPELCDWLLDTRIGGFLNSSTREHMPEDLHRYLFAACYLKVKKETPRLREFPESLRPDHKNVPKSLGHDNFSDRFRVQRDTDPATTVMSHIAKDGHYFIHWDPAQCRSLTVREAARLQTFPDNFLFCGNRTEQYTQVGNAVPPFLARQIAAIVSDLIVKRQ